MPSRKKKSRPRKKTAVPEVSELEHQQLLADATRIINAWAKHAPNKKFGGISLEEFRKAVQPSFDADAQIAQIEWELARLKKQLDEDFEPPKGN
jgi:hypothetical protein